MMEPNPKLTNKKNDEKKFVVFLFIQLNESYHEPL